ncbi:Amine oxidase [flavin-containing] [Collichthys lucidus]|uniref:Amine oxidase n=1 Tax=Collichthys lucidus TaxID=240159 RepID=A0A4U5V9V8_COLLU|nr:Amine oxidase [flavin-containing] [Collichthys lucidus]
MTEEIWDVIIVGAGLSGLSAAHLLKKRNDKLKILVTEAKDRVGGRTVTSEIPAANGVDRWDFGGQWVGSTQPHVLELIKELGIETYRQFTDGKKVYHMGGPNAKVRIGEGRLPALSLLGLMDLAQLYWKIETLSATICVEDPSKSPNAFELDSMTVQTYLDQHAWTTEVKEQMAMCSRPLFGLEPSQMSFLYFLMYAATAGGLLPLLESNEGSGQELKLKGGTQQLSKGLAERIGWKNVQLGAAVTAIWQDAEYAKVMTATNTYLCRAVIVTCPLNLAGCPFSGDEVPFAARVCLHIPLNDWVMLFVFHFPHTSNSQRDGKCLCAMRKVQSEKIMEIGKPLAEGYHRCDSQAFWKEKGYSGEIATGSSTNCPFTVTFDASTPYGSPALVGFIAGKQANEWSSKEVGERRDAVVSRLVKYLGPEAASFIHYEEKDWAKEPYSGGCPVNVMVPGALTYYHPSLKSPCGRYYSVAQSAYRSLIVVAVIMPSLIHISPVLKKWQKVNRIHWASTETATSWCGYMTGAIQEGQRAAREVLAKLCPNALTQEDKEAAQESQTIKQKQPSKLSFLPSIKTLVLAAVAIGAAVLLAQNPDALENAKTCDKMVLQ